MQRLLLLSIFIAFLFCYLEWPNNSGFIFQMEYTVISTGIKSMRNVTHPLILIPLAGQLLLLFTVFQRSPNRRLAVISILFLSVLVLVLFLVGLLIFDLKIILSTLPFLLLAVYYLFFFRKDLRQPAVT